MFLNKYGPFPAWYNKLGIYKTYDDKDLDKNWCLISLTSHDDEDGYFEGYPVRNRLTIAFLRRFRTWSLPLQILKPLYDYPTYKYDGEDKYRISHKKLEEMGCDIKYKNFIPNEWRFSIWGEHMSIKLRDIGDMLYNESNIKPLFSFWWNFSWKHSERTKHQLLNLDGSVFYDVNNDWNFVTPSGKRAYDEWKEKEEEQPSIKFSFKDYDNEDNVATCKMEYSEYTLGDNKFNRWLYKTLGSKPDVYKTLDLSFEKEIGQRKGSWKGGTMGHSVNMLEGETPEVVFKRYCLDPTVRGGRESEETNMTFVGTNVTIPPVLTTSPDSITEAEPKITNDMLGKRKAKDTPTNGHFMRTGLLKTKMVGKKG